MKILCQYEWQAVTVVNGFPVVFALVVSLAALPLLGMLIILATSIAELFRVSLPRLVLLKRRVAGWGLATQLLFDIFVFQIYIIGYNQIDIVWGFVVVLTSFIITVIDAFVVVFHQGHKRATHS